MRHVVSSKGNSRKPISHVAPIEQVQRKQVAKSEDDSDLQQMPQIIARSRPMVSVLMPIYNSQLYLRDAIHSVLTQEGAVPWELLLVDDGSTDESLEIAREYAARHPDRISLLQHDCGRNRGISASRNLALRHAKGEIIGFLDSDDVWLPHHMSTLCDVLLQHPEAAAVYGSAERWIHFDQEFDRRKSAAAWWGENYLPPMIPTGESIGLLPPGKLLTWFLEDETLVPCICSMLVRTRAARAVGGFVDDFQGLYDDQAFHAKLSLKFSVYALDVCVARYRMHPGSCCATGRLHPAAAKIEREKFLDFVQSYGDRPAPIGKAPSRKRSNADAARSESTAANTGAGGSGRAELSLPHATM